MESRIQPLTDLPLPLRCLVRMAADFLIIGIPLWIYITLNHYFPVLYRSTEWGLLILGAILFLSSLYYHILHRQKSDADGRGLAFIEVAIYYLSGNYRSQDPEKIKGEKIDPRKKHLFLYLWMQWILLPIMVQFTIMTASQFLVELERVVHSPVEPSLKFFFNQVLFPISLCLVFFIDFFWYSLSYILETPPNRLRSVGAYGWGWLVVIISLLPLYYLIAEISPIGESAFAQFPGYPIATSLLRLAIWICLLVYLWSMLSLGHRRTHLANKGVVTLGAYRWVRHPGYMALQGIWWLAFLPLILNNPLWVPALMGWALLFLYRADQEEKLLIQDPIYRDYCQKVPYRFLPFIY